MKKVGQLGGVVAKSAPKLKAPVQAKPANAVSAQLKRPADTLDKASAAVSAASAKTVGSAVASSVIPAQGGLGVGSLLATQFGATSKLRKEPVRVISPGQQVNAFERISTVEAVPEKYRSDPRFTELSSDPAHDGAQTATSLREAMSGLEAELKGFLDPPIIRGPAEIEFFDAQGHSYDVKTPRSPPASAKWTFNARKAARSITKQLEKSHENPKTMQMEPVRVILDSTYMSRTDHAQIWRELESKLDAEQLRRIVEVNVEVQ